MKVSGFTIARNAMKLDYPVREAILSILPLCDEVVVAVGQSDDNTLDVIRQLPGKKIKIIETLWDDSQREGGKVLALETDKAFAAVARDSDWCFYVQADEVLHERYYATIRSAMEEFQNSPEVEALLFHYKHFFGSYDYVGSSWNWYRREIRIVRNNPDIFSYKDAQGFRRRPNQKLKAKLLDAEMYHYGWVRDPRAMQEKQRAFNHFYHDDEWIEKNVARADEFDYSQIDSLERFTGTHPLVMKERIARLNWKFAYDISMNRLTFRERLKRFGSNLLGRRIGEYRNYKLI